MRSRARACPDAVTRAPVEKRAFLRLQNVYVLPSFETTGSASASSGRRRRPSGSGLSGKAISVLALGVGGSKANPLIERGIHGVDAAEG